MKRSKNVRMTVWITEAQRDTLLHLSDQASASLSSYTAFVIRDYLRNIQKIDSAHGRLAFTVWDNLMREPMVKVKELALDFVDKEMLSDFLKVDH